MNLADSLNLGCACQTLEAPNLREQLETSPALAGLTERLAQSHPHLFSKSAVFLDPGVQAQIADAVAAIERVIALPAWRQQALARAPQIASVDHGPGGVFMGYDFHITDDGPRLIEINSNAGGAFLNAALARAHRACCASFKVVFDPRDQLRTLDSAFIDMFRAEWIAQRGLTPWRNVVIVDDAPLAQYLAPEFELARALFTAHGLQAVIADPGELQWRDGALWHPAWPEQPVDMVYNRLTDFYLQDGAHAALRLAHEAGAAVLTPHPRTHALYAHKHNLIVLSDDAQLAAWGVTEADRDILRRVVPATRHVTPETADVLWAQRRTLFFKPAAGFGARATYRGDKLTRRVWDEILAADYVAQTIVPPSERLVRVGDQTTHLKLDLRAYSYRGQVQLLAARTWTGQTTNFRTEGGGFSPVVVLPETDHPLQ
ncbi:hypothetical protein [Hydrogenophaga sp. RWCD_12]|uniref:hypothetical protein n=1 Tax=Hydrogenophaga sp. RWCD_12 TaxID=3391190 RepID=UPI003984CB6D